MMRTTLFSILHTANSIDEAAKEKFTPFSSLSLDESYQSRDLEKVSQHLAKSFYDAKVQPTTLVPKEVGNMYTASLYAAFVSLIHNKHNDLPFKHCIMDVGGKLKARHEYAPEKFVETMKLMETWVRSKGLCDDQRGGILDLLAPGTYYLKRLIRCIGDSNGRKATMDPLPMDTEP